MPKIIRPYFGDAAFGKNGKSASSLIYARTSSECESTKMVTYTKSYKAPIQPDSALQLSVRDKMRQLILSLKAFKDRYIENSLYGTYPVVEPTFVSDRSRYISLCLKNGISFFKYNFFLQKVSDLFSAKMFYDDLFFAYFANTDFNFAFQIRGDQTNKYFYRKVFKLQDIDFDSAETLEGRAVHYNNSAETLVIDGDDFSLSGSYNARFWASLIPFPSPPVSPDEDATSTFDIGNSVRMDVPFTVYKS